MYLQTTKYIQVCASLYMDRDSQSLNTENMLNLSFTINSPYSTHVQVYRPQIIFKFVLIPNICKI